MLPLDSSKLAICFHITSNNIKKTPQGLRTISELGTSLYKTSILEVSNNELYTLSSDSLELRGKHLGKRSPLSLDSKGYKYLLDSPPPDLFFFIRYQSSFQSSQLQSNLSLFFQSPIPSIDMSPAQIQNSAVVKGMCLAFFTFCFHLDQFTKCLALTASPGAGCVVM